MNLKDKIILITGASSGIGAACARIMAEKGAIIVMQARSVDKLQNLREELADKGGQAHIYPTDLTDISAVRKQAKLIKQEVGIPDVIINSAGAGNWLTIFDTSETDFQDMIASPYFATVNTIKAFLNDMVIRNSGHIITINSAASNLIFKGALGYMAARWVLRAFQGGLYEELRSTNVLTTSIVAGKVDSPYFTTNPISVERLPKIGEMIMKTLTVDQVAKVVLKTVFRKKKTIIIPWQMALAIKFGQHFPGILGWLMRITAYKGIPDEIEKIRQEIK